MVFEDVIFVKVSNPYFFKSILFETKFFFQKSEIHENGNNRVDPASKLTTVKGKLNKQQKLKKSFFLKWFLVVFG
jgi:hypothetical protein